MSNQHSRLGPKPGEQEPSDLRRVLVPIVLGLIGAVAAYGLGVGIGFGTKWSQRGIAAASAFFAGLAWAMMVLFSIAKGSKTRPEYGAAGLLAGLCAPIVSGLVFGAATGEVDGVSHGPDTTFGELTQAAIYFAGALGGWLGVFSGAVGWLFGMLVGGNAPKQSVASDFRPADRPEMTLESQSGKIPLPGSDQVPV